uniref:Uncharacterized protein n=1 Tax=Anguilla anguilla TaxID=7936 RepID=A0A0E9VIG2_ANGAN
MFPLWSAPIFSKPASYLYFIALFNIAFWRF